MTRTRAVTDESTLAREQWVKQYVDEKMRSEFELNQRMLTATYNNTLNARIAEERKWVEKLIEDVATDVIQHLYLYIEANRLHRRVGRAIAGAYRQADLVIGNYVVYALRVAMGNRT